MTEDEKSLIKDMLKSDAWKLYERMVDESIKNYREMATQQNVKLEDRLWYSALAQGKEESLLVIKQTISQ